MSLRICLKVGGTEDQSDCHDLRGTQPVIADFADARQQGTKQYGKPPEQQFLVYGLQPHRDEVSERQFIPIAKLPL